MLVNKRKNIGLKHLIILNLSLNTRIMWMVLIKMMKNIELFIRGRKLNISLVFMTQSLFFCTEKCKAKFETLFTKIPNKRELQ